MELEAIALSSSPLDCVVPMDATAALVEFNPSGRALLRFTRAEQLGRRVEKGAGSGTRINRTVVDRGSIHAFTQGANS